MARYCATVDSSQPADAVFRYLKDFATIAEWDPGVAEARLVAGAPGEVGARYLVNTVLFGRTTPLEYEIVVTAAAPDGTRRVDLRAENSDLISYDVITVRPQGDGCQVTYDADLALKGLRRPFDPALRVVFAVIGRRAERGLAQAVNSPLVGRRAA